MAQPHTYVINPHLYHAQTPPRILKRCSESVNAGK